MKYILIILIVLMSLLSQAEENSDNGSKLLQQWGQQMIDQSRNNNFDNTAKRKESHCRSYYRTNIYGQQELITNCWDN